MESYEFKCGACGSQYVYTGFKTGIGKTPAQLKQMEDERHVCRDCGHDDRQGGENNKHGPDMSPEANAAAGFAAECLTPPDKPTRTFEVPVVRNSWGTRRIRVKAVDAEEAKRKALEQAGDEVFKEEEADYWADVPEEIKES